MTNPDSVLKSRPITLPTKVRVVKALAFPGVAYGCENCTVKKAEHQRICFQTVVLEKTLERPLESKEINPEYSLEGLRLQLKLQYFGHLVTH